MVLLVFVVLNMKLVARFFTATTPEPTTIQPETTQSEYCEHC